MSGALISASRRVGTVQNGVSSDFCWGKKRKEKLWTTGQLVTDKIGPSDRGLHAPVRLSGVKESSQSSTGWVRRDTSVMNLDTVATQSQLKRSLGPNSWKGC